MKGKKNYATIAASITEPALCRSITISYECIRGGTEYASALKAEAFQRIESSNLSGCTQAWRNGIRDCLRRSFLWVRIPSPVLCRSSRIGTCGWLRTSVEIRFPVGSSPISGTCTSMVELEYTASSNLVLMRAGSNPAGCMKYIYMVCWTSWLSCRPLKPETRVRFPYRLRSLLRLFFRIWRDKYITGLLYFHWKCAIMKSSKGYKRCIQKI